MNAQSFTLAERLIPSTYVQQAVSAKKWRENLIKTFIEQVLYLFNFKLLGFSSSVCFITVKTLIK